MSVIHETHSAHSATHVEKGGESTDSTSPELAVLLQPEKFQKLRNMVVRSRANV